ncbi:hypothetical protein M2145_001953 [Lachnospiraceae bacterium PF1-21]
MWFSILVTISIFIIGKNGKIGAVAPIFCYDRDMEAYYYSKMNKTQQNIYHAMKVGLVKLEPSFAIPKTDGGELQEIFFKLRLDHPEIFYAVGYRYKFYQEASHVLFIPEYLFTKKKVVEQGQMMNARVSKLAAPLKGKSEKEKEQAIHDFICQNVRYDKLKKPYSHEIIGPLGHGVSVCEGIAKTVKVLCDAVGLWCIIAISEANPEKGIKYRHAWNIIRIEGKYFHLDATFDNTLGGGEMVRYDYFNLSDQQVFKDHEPVIYPVPKCESKEHFYYREKKLSFTKMEDVKKRVPQAIRKNKPLIFHWRGGHLTQQVLADLVACMEQAAREKERHASISLNRPQGVFNVTFAEQLPGSELLFAKANEGECL